MRTGACRCRARNSAGIMTQAGRRGLSTMIVVIIPTVVPSAALWDRFAIYTNADRWQIGQRWQNETSNSNADRRNVDAETSTISPPRDNYRCRTRERGDTVCVRDLIAWQGESRKRALLRRLLRWDRYRASDYEGRGRLTSGCCNP